MTILGRRWLLHGGAVLGSSLLLNTAACGTAAGRSGDRTDNRAGDRADGQVGTAVSVLGRPCPNRLWILHGDGSDTTALWEEALAAIGRAGTGSVRVTGDHVISRELTLPDVTRLEIVGEADALLRKARPGQEFRIFSAEPPTTPGATLTIRRLQLLGDWDAAMSMGTYASRCIGVRGYHRVVLQDLTAAAFRDMTFTCDDCDAVRVEGCRIDRSARDSINLTGSRLVKVVNCTIVNGWDDAIAIHVPRDVTDEGRRWAALIADNQIVQAHGIKVLGGRDVSIMGNQILAPNNYGIYVGHDPFWHEGGAPHRNLLITDNIVSEAIGPDYLPGQGDIGSSIFCTDPGRSVMGARITNNIISKFKPSGRGVHFSDWQFGASPSEHRLFTSDGWIDPELVFGHQGTGVGIRVVAANARDERAIVIEGNSFANLGQDVERTVED